MGQLAGKFMNECMKMYGPAFSTDGFSGSPHGQIHRVHGRVHGPV